MRLVPYTSAVVAAGCSFIPGQFDVRDDAPVPDAPGGDTNEEPDDAPPDAPPVATTTDHPSIADTYIAAEAQNTNFGDEVSALVDGADNDCVVLLRFDLAGIATTATVTGAELHLWTHSDPGDAATFYPLLEDWNEATATWNNRINQIDWSAEGAAPPSRGTTAVGTVTGAQPITEYTVTISTETVAGWVATPAMNFGLAIFTNNSNGTRFAMREHGTAIRRPYLRVTHTP